MSIDYELYGPTLDSDGQIVARPRRASRKAPDEDAETPAVIERRESLAEVGAYQKLHA